MKRVLFGPLVVVVLAIGCSHGPRAADSFSATPSTRAEVYRFVQRYMEAANRSDQDTMMSMVLRDQAVSSVANGEITTGWDAIREQVQMLNAVPADIHVTIEGDPAQYQLDPDSVLVVAPYTLTARREGRTLELHAVTTLVLVRESGAWKVLHEHNSGNCQKIHEFKANGR